MPTDQDAHDPSAEAMQTDDGKIVVAAGKKYRVNDDGSVTFVGYQEQEAGDEPQHA
jgi:hypothetical protein